MLSHEVHRFLLYKMFDLCAKIEKLCFTEARWISSITKKTRSAIQFIALCFYDGKNLYSSLALSWINPFSKLMYVRFNTSNKMKSLKLFSQTFASN